MKSLLQINLQSKAIDKSLYAIKRNSLLINPYSSSQSKFKKIRLSDQNNCQKSSDHENLEQYTFDNISYNFEDINSAILYDLVVSSTDEVNLSINEVTNSNNPKIVSLIFDQVYCSDFLPNFIQQLNKIDMFKSHPVKIAHFMIHNKNSLFDYHNYDCKISSESSRGLQNEAEKQSEENFMGNFHKQLNLCEQIRPYQITHIFDIVSYVSVTEFTNEIKNKHKFGKQAEKIRRQFKEIQSKKISQFYVVKIGEKLHLNFIVLNFNKNYTLPSDEKKDINSIYTLYGSQTPEIKYKTIKTQIINKLIKGCQKLYYITYFPGPSIQALCLNYPNKNQLAKSKWMECNQLQKQTQNLFNLSMNVSNSSLGKQSLLQTYGLKSHSTLSRFQNSLASMNQTVQKQNQIRLRNKKQQRSKIEQIKISEQIQNVFISYKLLKSLNKQQIQAIIKEYLQKKEQVVKSELDRVNQSIRELKIAHRIQQCQVGELKHKTIRALQKISCSIKQLQKMGIKNIGKHIDWLQTVTEQKKNHIKETEEDIEGINQRIVQNQNKHDYFVKKMKQFRNRLIQKKNKLKIADPIKKEQIIDISVSSIHQHTVVQSNKENMQGQNTIKKLTQHQQQVLQNYKESLKIKMNDRLRACSQKKQFMSRLAEIKVKISKMEFSRLQQKYFDLMVD